jgi:hypothetical protein
VKKITITIEESTFESIKSLVDQININSADSAEFSNSHGKLTVKSAIEMIVEDLGLAESRPGSWEGANMTQVLSSHGYRW